MSTLAKKFREFYAPLKYDIFAYARALGVNVTSQQAQLLQAVQERPAVGRHQVAAKSGQGIGKTAASCIIGSWRVLQHVDAMTYVTAPTMRQCKDVWLTEFRRIVQNAPYPIWRKIFDITKSRVIVANRENWNIRFVTATKPEAAQGIHEDNLTFLMDETSGIERPFIEQIIGTMGNENSLLVATGNPNIRDCSFFDFFNSHRRLWKCLTFSARDSPLVSPANIQNVIDMYTEDSDVFRVRVDGEFPGMDPNCIISSDDLEKCINTPLYLALSQPRRLSSNNFPAKQFGIDFARFGSDESVICRVSGHAMMELEFYSHVEPKDVIARAFRMQSEARWPDDQTWFCPDANGLGEGVVYQFGDARKNYLEFKAQRRAQSREFADMTTEAWFQFARKVRKGTVRLKNDPILFKQLSTRKYYLTAKGQIKVESKDEYKDRDNNESPDRADACVMAYYDEVEADAQATGAFSQVSKRKIISA